MPDDPPRHPLAPSGVGQDPDEAFDLLDDEGRRSGEVKARHAVHRDGDWHAAVHLWIVDDEDRLVVQRRSRFKDLAPGKLDVTVGGHLAAGEHWPSALREAEEEIGLSARHVEILGPIDGHETVTGYAVTPFVGFVDRAFEPRPDPAEVAEVFEPPLAFLMDPANRTQDHRAGPGGRRSFWAMPWEGRYIWGATARMLVSLSDRLAAEAADETAE